MASSDLGRRAGVNPNPNHRVGVRVGRGRSKGGEGRAWVGARLRTARVMGAMVAVARAEVLKEAVARVVEARGRGAGEKVAWSGRWRRARMQPERACSITEKPSRMFRGNSSAIAGQLLGEPLRNRAQSRELQICRRRLSFYILALKFEG